MRALVWHGKSDVRCDTVPDPVIEDPRDMIVKITSTAIRGSDLHLYDHYMPAMEKGDILGHEPMGEVVEVGSAITKFQKGDRVVVPFTICCGECFFCKKELWSCCDRTNRDKEKAEKVMGHAPAGLYGYSHLRDIIPVVRPSIYACGTTDPARSKSKTTSQPRTSAVLVRHFSNRLHGCGKCRDRTWRHGRRLGLRAGRPVLHSKRVDVRRRTCHRHRPSPGTPRNGAETWPGRDNQFRKERCHCLRTNSGDERTAGGADRCIDAVGAEAHATGSFDALLDKTKASVFLATDRAHVLREAIWCCRKGGTISVPGVYIGFTDKIPLVRS